MGLLPAIFVVVSIMCERGGERSSRNDWTWIAIQSSPSRCAHLAKLPLSIWVVARKRRAWATQPHHFSRGLWRVNHCFGGNSGCRWCWNPFVRIFEGHHTLCVSEHRLQILKVHAVQFSVTFFEDKLSVLNEWSQLNWNETCYLNKLHERSWVHDFFDGFTVRWSLVDCDDDIAWETKMKFENTHAFYKPTEMPFVCATEFFFTSIIIHPDRWMPIPKSTASIVIGANLEVFEEFVWILTVTATVALQCRSSGRPLTKKLQSAAVTVTVPSSCWFVAKNEILKWACPILNRWSKLWHVQPLFQRWRLSQALVQWTISEN